MELDRIVELENIRDELIKALESCYDWISGGEVMTATTLYLIDLRELIEEAEKHGKG